MISRRLWLPLLIALPLAACQAQPDTEARLRARQQAVDPPTFWRMDTLAADGAATGTRFVCADTPLRQTFTRLAAEIEGAPCRVTRGPVATPGLFAFRCEQGGRAFAMASQAQGDLGRDFRLTVSVTPLGGDLGPARTVRRFQLAGACPPGWRVGDQADAARQTPPAPLRKR